MGFAAAREPPVGLAVAKSNTETQAHPIHFMASRRL
jgi:hypothetical protein